MLSTRAILTLSNIYDEGFLRKYLTPKIHALLLQKYFIKDCVEYCNFT